MNKYLDNVTIGHWNINRPMTLPGFGGNSIINFTANQQLNSGWLAHELGHVWDMNTSSGLPYVGGAADALNTFIDGQGDTIFNNRVINNADHNPTKYIPVTTTINGYVYNNHFNKNIFFHGDYGNNATADYLAETFTGNIYDNSNVPFLAQTFVNVLIAQEASNLP